MRVDLATLDDAEQALVEQAALLSLDELNVGASPSRGDPGSRRARAEDRRPARREVLDLPSGSVGCARWSTRKFDPENGAPIKAALEAYVTHVLRTSRGHNVVWDDAGLGDGGLAGRGLRVAPTHAVDGPADERGGTGRPSRRGRAGEAGVGEAGPVIPETRSVPQMQADALAAICRHMLGCDDSEVPLESTTVVVQIPLEAVTDGTGVATIDGIDQPIDAGSARRMAACARIIPMVLGTDSEVLDLGRSKRFFNRAQRRALVQRDGGCASCGLPPSMTEAHHIEWWELQLGKTDLSNGILLCTRCHHMIHKDGWEIRIDPPPSGDPTGGTVWFIPPMHVDPDQKPRLGGTKALRLHAQVRLRPRRVAVPRLGQAGSDRAALGSSSRFARSDDRGPRATRSTRTTSSTAGTSCAAER